MKNDKVFFTNAGEESSVQVKPQRCPLLQFFFAALEVLLLSGWEEEKKEGGNDAVDANADRFGTHHSAK